MYSKGGCAADSPLKNMPGAAYIARTHTIASTACFNGEHANPAIAEPSGIVRKPANATLKTVRMLALPSSLRHKLWWMPTAQLHLPRRLLIQLRLPPLLYVLRL